MTSRMLCIAALLAACNSHPGFPNAPSDAVDVTPTGPTDTATFTATVPTIAGASSYQLYTSCGQLFAGPSGAVTGTLVGCGGTADILVIALDAAAAILGSLYAPGVPVDQPA